MPKKLMMNYSENGMSPIIDGLVCWLDARDFEDNMTILKDRTNFKNDFKVEDVFKNSKQALRSKNNGQLISYDMDIPQNYTIEFYCYYSWFEFSGIFSLGLNSNSTHNYDYLWTYPDKAHLSLRRRNNGTWEQFDNFFALELNKIYLVTVAFNLSKKTAEIYMNGIKIKTITFKNYTYVNTKTIVLMNSASGVYPFLNGGVYSVKIYNKTLTEEEIQHNYLYEQSIKRGE